MPIKKAAIKALNQAKKHALHNKVVKNALRELLKRSRRSLAEKKIDEAKELINKTIKTLDKAVKSKILKQNTASRLKSRLVKRFAELTKKV